MLATDMTRTACVMRVRPGAGRVKTDAHQDGKGGDLGRHGDVCGNRHRRPLIGVGGPHVEGHGGDLEADAHGHKSQPREKQGRR